MYFQKPELFFTEIVILFYVIDIQDPWRFEESKKYFRKMIKILKDLNEYPPIMVYFHKFDPSMIKSQNTGKSIA